MPDLGSRNSCAMRPKVTSSPSLQSASAQDLDPMPTGSFHITKVYSYNTSFSLLQCYID